jgi:hypothetical protein
MRCHQTPIKQKNFTGAILTTLVLFAFLPASYGQTKEEIVNNALLSVRLINMDPGLKTIKLENEDFFRTAAEGGSRMTAYFKGDIICKIEVRSILSYGVSQCEYYLRNSRPFFIYETEEGYPKKDSTGSVDRTLLALNFEGKYTFDNGRLIDKKIKGRKQLEGGTSAANSEGGSELEIKGLLTNADVYIKILQDRLKEIQAR